MTVTQQILLDEERAFLGDIEEISPALLGKFPLAPYLADLRNPDPRLPYDPFSDALVGTLEQIEAEFGRPAVSLYHKLSLCRLMRDFLANRQYERFPAPVQQLYARWFDRVTTELRTQPDSYYDIDQPLWPLRKDICICSGRSIPVGGALVVERKLLPRRSMIRRALSLRQVDDAGSTPGSPTARRNVPPVLSRLRQHPAARRIVQAAGRALGTADLCYVIHTLERDIQQFNEDQMNLAYRNIASLLEADGDVWGVYRSSWFLDPAVGGISPNMAYLLQVPLQRGAELHDNGPSTDKETCRATMMSPERSRLYKRGEYVPRNYFYVWPRRRIIEAFGREAMVFTTMQLDKRVRE